MAGIINPNRDYFDGNTSVSGTAGVLSGPLSSRPGSGAIVGQGYWATDQGAWNHGFSGTQTGSAILPMEWVKISSLGTTNWATLGDVNGTAAAGDCFLTITTGAGTGSVVPAQGQLSVWNGGAWVLRYTPYTYPFYSSGPIDPSNLSISSP